MVEKARAELPAAAGGGRHGGGPGHLGLQSCRGDFRRGGVGPMPLGLGAASREHVAFVALPLLRFSGANLVHVSVQL